MNYEALYKPLFNGMTDAVRALEQQHYVEARLCLIRAQQDAEELFITDDDGEENKTS
jgi:hypothetical protein